MDYHHLDKQQRNTQFASPIPLYEYPTLAYPPTAQPVFDGTYAAHHQYPVAMPSQPPQPVQPAQQFGPPHVQPTYFIPPRPTLAELQAIVDRPIELFCTSLYFKEACQFYKINCLMLTAAILMWGVKIVIFFFTMLAAIESLDFNMNFDMEHNELSDDQLAVCIAMVSLAFAFGLFVLVPAQASFLVAIFNAIRTNSKIRFVDFYSCFRCQQYCRLIPLTVVVSIMTALLFCLIFPAFWWVVSTVFAYPLLLDNGVLGICQAISLSIQAVRRNFCAMLGFLLLLALLQGAFSMMTMGLSLIVTLPFSLIAISYCYHHQIGINEVPRLVLS